MAQGKVRLGIIGAGQIARKHLEVLEAAGDAELAGIVSRTREHGEALARDFGGAPVFDDLDALVHKARPDALMVLVSVASTVDVAQRALASRLPLFIEKPAGLSPQQTEALARAADDLGVRTMVGYNRRHYSIFHTGVDIIRRHGRLLGILIEGHERIDAARARNKHPDAVLDAWIYANSTHTIDLLRFFGGEPVAMKCITHRRREPLGDQFAAIFDFDSGALGHYAAHWLSPGGWRVSLYGEGVTVDYKPLETGTWTDSAGHIHEIAPSDEDRRFKPGFFGQMQSFCAFVRDAGSRSPHDLWDAHRTMRLAEQMTGSAVDRP